MVVAPVGFFASFSAGEFANMNVFRWIVLVVIILTFTLSTYYNIAIFFKVPYIEITETQIIRKTAFGRIKTVELSSKIEYQHKNGRLLWINIYDEDNNIIDLIGDVYQASLISIRDEIEKKATRT